MNILKQLELFKMQLPFISILRSRMQYFRRKCWKYM